MMTETTEAGAAAQVSTAELRVALEQGQRMFKAFRFADQALALIDNLEQVTRERQAAADKAEESANALRAQVAAAVTDVESAKAEAKAVRAKAKADAEKRQADSESRAAEMLSEAQGKVDALNAQTESLVADLLAKNDELNALVLRLADAQSVIDRAEKAREALALVSA